jgi:hypothetical protein
VLTKKQKWNILKSECQLTERRGYGFSGFSLNRKSEMTFYGVTQEECLSFAEKRGWFKKFEGEQKA